MNDEAVPAAKPAEAYGRLRDAFERIVRRPADYGEVDALRSLIVGAGYIPPLSEKAEPVQIDRVIAKIKAARDWLDSEEAKVGTWWSPILRKQSIRTRFINKIDSALDAYLAAQPVAGAVETDTAKTVRQLHELCAGSGLSLEQALGAAGVLDKLATTEHALEAAAADVERLERENAELVAVIGQVRSIGARSGTDINAWNKAFDVLATSPAEALKAVKADAWDEGLDAGRDRWMDSREFGDKPVNPYRTEAN